MARIKGVPAAAVADDQDRVPQDEACVVVIVSGKDLRSLSAAKRLTAAPGSLRDR